MSVDDDLTAIQRCLDDLDRAVARLERALGRGGLEVRRIRTDAGHLRESVALLRADGPPAGAAAGPVPRQQPQGRPLPMVPVPDTPYDSSLWTDADEEGLGSRNRRAP
ncbi:hypothetical protein [Streptomyces mashuensis]|uniref:hypothetical protein n=1 Tax=Streptomyces mashuensis TaxID=33904 RepID=UPI00167E62B4|nr:hypothetical protein [Streptomyces mashuensis]